MNEILQSCVQIIKNSNVEKLSGDSMRLLVKLLSVPLETFSLSILGMNHYPTLMQYMAYQSRKTVSLRIVKAVFKSRKPLNNLDSVE